MYLWIAVLVIFIIIIGLSIALIVKARSADTDVETCNNNKNTLRNIMIANMVFTLLLFMILIIKNLMTSSNLDDCTDPEGASVRRSFRR